MLVQFFWLKYVWKYHQCFHCNAACSHIESPAIHLNYPSIGIHHKKPTHILHFGWPTYLCGIFAVWKVKEQFRTALQESGSRGSSIGTPPLKTDLGWAVHKPLMMKPCNKLLKTNSVPALDSYAQLSHSLSNFVWHLHELRFSNRVWINPPWPYSPASA